MLFSSNMIIKNYVFTLYINKCVHLQPQNLMLALVTKYKRMPNYCISDGSLNRFLFWEPNREMGSTAPVNFFYQIWAMVS